MAKQKLWIISEVFYPVEASTGHIMTRIAEFMASYSDVEVLTGPSQYDTLQYNKKGAKDFQFRINRVEAGNLDKNGLLSRAVRQFWISVSFCWFILRRVKSGEKVLMVTNPAFMIVAMAVLKKIKRFSLDILVHDVFPENLVAAGVMKEKDITYSMLKNAFDWAYGNADKLIVLGIDMKYKLLEKTISKDTEIHIVQNWADIEAVRIESFETNEIIKKHDLTNKVVLAFTGNIGRVQGIEGLINLIGEVKNDNLHFLFVGDGALAEKVQELSERTSRVTYLGRLPRKLQNKFLNACRIGIVTINDQMAGLGVPSKSYNILAAGKPILFLGNAETEIAEMVKENDLGWTFEHSQHDHILEFLNTLNSSQRLFSLDNSERIRKYADDNYSEGRMLQKLREIIEG